MRTFSKRMSSALAVAQNPSTRAAASLFPAREKYHESCADKGEHHCRVGQGMPQKLDLGQQSERSVIHGATPVSGMGGHGARKDCSGHVMRVKLRSTTLWSVMSAVRPVTVHCCPLQLPGRLLNLHEVLRPFGLRPNDRHSRASKSKLSIARLWKRVAKTMVRPVCARTTTRTTMQLSSLVRTGTTPKWFATNPRSNPSIEGTSASSPQSRHRINVLTGFNPIARSN